MLSFLRALWQGITTVRRAVTNIIFLAIVIFIVVAIISNETASVPEKTALVINPTGVIVEQKHPVDPFARLTQGEDKEAETLLRDITDAIDAGAEDKRVKVLVLDLEGLAGAPMSMLLEIGQSLDHFKQTGKPVYAFGSSYSQSQYLLAAHASQVYLDKHAVPALPSVFLTGIGVYPTFFKSALDRFKVKFHIFRVGEFKSAVEPYLRDDMSEEARAETRDWVDSLWDSYARTVTHERGITAEAFDRYTNRYDVLLDGAKGDSASLAVSEGLVDEQITQEVFRERLLDLVGEHDGNPNALGFREYLGITRPPIPVVNPTSKKIAVIVAKGTILDGEQPPGDIGAESLSRLIEQARKDKTVKGVVLRIDSPGGSASAAERIRSELALLQDDGKPVVVSMSGYAASGGYWVSATANRIFAEETTITGSIGTFLLFPTFGEALGEFGIHSDGIGTTTLSGSTDPLLPLNPVMERLLQQGIRNTYDNFLAIVAEGRGMT
ncbi:MAG: signal peptide peptidase SppA, partial [Pseudomonadales bacterium]|nr:signal peptide peptidase SppA [Pseudomonadales bacterium]